MWQLGFDHPSSNWRLRCPTDSPHSCWIHLTVASLHHERIRRCSFPLLPADVTSIRSFNRCSPPTFTGTESSIPRPQLLLRVPCCYCRPDFPYFSAPGPVVPPIRTIRDFCSLSLGEETLSSLLRVSDFSRIDSFLSLFSLNVSWLLTRFGV